VDGGDQWVARPLRPALADLAAHLHPSAFGPGANRRDLAWGNAERLEKILMGLGRARLELDVPAMHLLLVEPGGRENLDPAPFVERARAPVEGAVLEEAYDHALLLAQAADLVVEPLEALREDRRRPALLRVEQRANLA